MCPAINAEVLFHTHYVNIGSDSEEVKICDLYDLRWAVCNLY